MGAYILAGLAVVAYVAAIVVLFLFGIGCLFDSNRWDRRRFLGVGSVVAALVMIGTGIGLAVYADRDTGPAAGYVVGRDHDAAWTQNVCSGSPPICTPVHHPERYRLRLEDGDLNGWVTVNGAVFDRCVDGEWCDPNDPDAGPPA